MDIVFQYPPELLQQLVQAIPLLCPGKKDVLLFFRGAGVEHRVYSDLEKRLLAAPKSIGKHEIARTVLTRLNADGERTLRERREVLRRVVDFEDFSTCWPDDQLKAKGAVAEIRRVVNVKDSFTRLKEERERDQRKHAEAHEARAREIQAREKQLDALKRQLYGLFAVTDPHRRGELLEEALNQLFGFYGILVRESFRRYEPGVGLLEQIDGVIELDGQVHLVEMKWLAEPVGVDDITRHLGRIFLRHTVGGFVISASAYTPPAIQTCRDALAKTTITLCTLQEIVQVLEASSDLKRFLKTKLQTTLVERNPFSVCNPQ